jgi:hypothetical protein
MKWFSVIIFLVLLACSAQAQSANENFPTPVTNNQISGKIAARDVGDARLTRHYYTFFADNGDLNLQIETENFDGDIDLFEAETLRPLAKITIVAAVNQLMQNSRTVYFRKREQVVLRIEGKALTDAAALYQINFSGSFAAAENLPAPLLDDPKIEPETSRETVAKVNSAGTIVEIVKQSKPESPAAETAEPKNAAPRPKTRKIPPPQPTKPRPQKTSDNTIKSVSKPASRRTTAAAAAAAPPTSQKESTADATANVRLILELKNGERIERSMSEVFNVRIDKAQITVITKNGKVERYNLVDVQKMTIE